MPTDRERIRAEVSFPKYQSNKRIPNVVSLYGVKFRFELIGDEPTVIINYADAVAALKRKKVREADLVTLTIGYPRAKSAEDDIF